MRILLPIGYIALAQVLLVGWAKKKYYRLRAINPFYAEFYDSQMHRSAALAFMKSTIFMMLLYSPLVTLGAVYFVIMPPNYCIFIVILIKYKVDWQVRGYSMRILYCIYFLMVVFHIAVAALFRILFLPNYSAF